jgi:nucleotide sugar dehydrogenase
MNKKILICGFGNIGKHIFSELYKCEEIDIAIYDRYTETSISDENILNEEYDYAFICVPTNLDENGYCDLSEVEYAVNHINADTIIIKSTIPVGTTKSFNKNNIVFSPEYYGTTQHSLDSPNFLVLGGSKEYSMKIVQLYQMVKDGSFRFIFVDSDTAELAKFMENSWIATKVTFCNEFADIANSFNINYEELRECFIADERVNPSHTFVYKDKPYYDSHCLNKDIPMIINTCEENHIDVPLLKGISHINSCRRKKYED